MLSARRPQNNTIGELSDMRRTHDLRYAMNIVHRSKMAAPPVDALPGFTPCGNAAAAHAPGQPGLRVTKAA